MKILPLAQAPLEHAFDDAHELAIDPISARVTQRHIHRQFLTLRHVLIDRRRDQRLHEIAHLVHVEAIPGAQGVVQRVVHLSQMIKNLRPRTNPIASSHPPSVSRPRARRSSRARRHMNPHPSASSTEEDPTLRPHLSRASASNAPCSPTTPPHRAPRTSRPRTGPRWRPRSRPPRSIRRPRRRGGRAGRAREAPVEARRGATGARSRPTVGAGARGPPPRSSLRRREAADGRTVGVCGDRGRTTEASGG